MEKDAWVETEEEQKKRFIMELEFVQCLSNPLYLQRMSITVCVGELDSPFLL